MGIVYALIAASFASLSNFSMRKSMDSGGTTKAFLMIQLSIACLVAFLLNPVRTGNYDWNVQIGLLGIASGLIFGCFMLSLGRALENGPPGLTIATLNASTVAPAIIMALFFGSFGFHYTLWHGLGSIVVIIGLFWAGWELTGIKNKTRWIFFAFGAFSLHALFLVIMQWKTMIITNTSAQNFFQVITSKQAQSQWFLPLTFFAAALIQGLVFFFSEKRLPQKGEWNFGVIGGIANSASMLFLLWAIEVASSLESAMLFPIFSVMIIFLCNAWGQLIYEERVNWKACHLCVFGLVVGTVDWKSVGSVFGF